jgi:hypothetical protein
MAPLSAGWPNTTMQRSSLLVNFLAPLPNVHFASHLLLPPQSKRALTCHLQLWLLSVPAGPSQPCSAAQYHSIFLHPLPHCHCFSHLLLLSEVKTCTNLPPAALAPLSAGCPNTIMQCSTLLINFLAPFSSLPSCLTPAAALCSQNMHKPATSSFAPLSAGCPNTTMQCSTLLVNFLAPFCLTATLPHSCCCSLQSKHAQTCHQQLWPPSVPAAPTQPCSAAHY